MVGVSIEVQRKGNGDKLEKLTERLLEEALPGALEIVGGYLEGKMIDKINSNIPPPLKPQTIKRKGSSLTLVDTGEMMHELTHVVDMPQSVKVGVIGARTEVAIVHEFGAPAAGVPERSFIRSTKNAEEARVKEIIKGELEKKALKM